METRRDRDSCTEREERHMQRVKQGTERQGRRAGERNRHRGGESPKAAHSATAPGPREEGPVPCGDPDMHTQGPSEVVVAPSRPWGTPAALRPQPGIRAGPFRLPGA